MRLDQYLVEKQLVPTRSKAQQLIRGGSVRVGGETVRKCAFAIEDAPVELFDAPNYVSRAAFKLLGVLASLPFACEGMRALDIGASTGGFTQVLLDAGVRGVDAVDVGKAQLHPTLRDDARVNSFEQTDIRRFETSQRYDIVTGDVSFISLLYILDAVDRLAQHWIVLLFKPQFEVGREAKRDKKGVVTDAGAIGKAMETFEAACAARGWRLQLKQDAAIAGKEGNIETCYCYEKH